MNVMKPKETTKIDAPSETPDIAPIITCIGIVISCVMVADRTTPLTAAVLPARAIRPCIVHSSISTGRPGKL